MTKEELEKEATEYALEWGDKTDGTYACCRDGYLAGAEPREERIAELGKENAELKETVIKMNNVITETFSNLTKAKSIIKDYKIVAESDHTTVCSVPEENRCINVYKLNESAEQFLKELNK